MLNYFSTKVTSKKYGFKRVNYFCYFMKDTDNFNVLYKTILKKALFGLPILHQ